MVYEHLRFAYPGAFAALCRTQRAKEERAAQAERAAKSEFSALSALSPGVAAQEMRQQRGGASRTARSASGRRRPWHRPSAEEPHSWPLVDPPRVEVKSDKNSLSFSVDESYAPGGFTKRAPTMRGHAEQVLCTNHVAHERLPGGGFFMASGADGFDIGLVKPHDRSVRLNKMTLTQGGLAPSPVPMTSRSSTPVSRSGTPVPRSGTPTMMIPKTAR